MGFWAAALPAFGEAAAGGLASGLVGKLLGGGGSDKRTTVTKQEIDLKKLVKDAQQAGFNPMTVLGMTGGAGFTSTTSTAKAPLSSANWFADAIGDGAAAAADSWFNRDVHARDEEFERIKLETAREELEAIQKRNDLPETGGRFGYTIPTYQGVGPGATGTGATVSAPALGPGNYRVESEPVLVARNDGLTGANPNAPAQPEEDLWSWGREGTFIENVDRVIDRNLPPELRSNDDLGGPINDSARWVRGKIGEAWKDWGAPAIPDFVPWGNAEPTRSPLRLTLDNPGNR